MFFALPTPIRPAVQPEAATPSTSKPHALSGHWRQRPGHSSGRGGRPRTMAPDKSFLASSLNTYQQAELDAIRARLTEQLQLAPEPESRPSLAKANDCPCDSDSNSSAYHPSQGWKPQPHHLSKEQLWERIRDEARADAVSEPALASFLYSTILAQPNFEKSMAFLLANKLANATMLGMQLMRLLQEAYDDDPSLVEAALADLQAVYDRDPACDKYTQAVLYFKGYQAVQCHRIAHWLWNKGRRALALAIQSRVSEAFHVDIHPAATLGRGILIDHATGVVIGETAVVGDNVSMLHHVTLGGSGTDRGHRHPTIGHGVLLGAGVKVVGPVSVGAGSKVGAGSVVVGDIPCYCVAVGIPAKIIKRDLQKEVVQDMDQCVDFVLNYEI